MSNSQDNSALIPSLRNVWKRTQRKHLSAGFLAMLRWGIPLFLAGMTIDWLTYMPSIGRVVILAIILGVSLYQAWRQGWQKLRPFNATRTALEVEEQHGGLQSILVTAVQFRESKMAGGPSSSLVDATCHKAEGSAKELQPARIINFKSLKTPLYIASALAAVVLVFALVNSTFLSAGLARIFTPWTKIAYPTNTQLELQQTDMVVKEGDSAKIIIGLSGVIPDSAEFYLRTGDGDPREIEIDVTDGSCEYTLASASRDFSYRVKAGDARSDWHDVKVIRAPRIDKVQVKLEFPSYLEKETETVEALTLTVPQNTKLEWQITLDQPIKEAVLHRDGRDPLPLELTNDGSQVTINEEVEASSGYSFSWVEKEHGFSFTSPRYFLQVSSDQAPRVELTSPESNLLALIGRPLSLAVRVNDDHGIGKTEVAYRVNQRDETKVAIKLPDQEAQGEQLLDWDYREAISDLKIGDTISFTMEVSDRYPGKDGPHIVRSDTRRITFLSKKAYLRQIQKKKDSLLSRVQTIYRQQRSAFDNVRDLDPDADTYIQTCQIEAIRQELVREQLKEIATKVKALIDDLAANNVSDAPAGESLELVRDSLLNIAEDHLANAAARLRHQSGVAAGDTQELPDPSSASRAVNTAARELASLVMLRSIDTAQEVYARESRMLAQVQADLRWRSVQAESAEARASISKEQEEIAQWTQRLITDLQNGLRFEKRPLAVLRLLQSVKDLQKAKTEERMKQAAVLINEAKTDQAEQMQSELVTTLLDAEFSVRLSGAYTTLIKTREKMRMLVKSQTMLREQCANMSAEVFKEHAARTTKEQIRLRKRLLTFLLPTVPAPRAQLLDDTFPVAPQVQPLLKKADLAMAQALKQSADGQQDATISQQSEAEQALKNLSKLVDQWTIEMGIKSLGLSKLILAKGERLSLIQEYEAKLIALLEKTDAAAAEEQKVDVLVESQQLLSEEITAFNNDLIKQHQENPDQDIPPLLSRMKRAEKAIQNVVISLKENNADKAIEQQEQAADILAEAFAMVTIQNEQIGMLQSLLMFQRSVEFANGFMSDMVAEQWDLLNATKALKSDDASKLIPMFDLLKSCMIDIAPLLDLVATRVDVGTPLTFAVSDLGDAVDSLEIGDKEDAIDAQDVAAESLGKVSKLVKSAKTQTGYIAEIVEFLHIAVADTNMLEYLQDKLIRKAESANPDQLKAIAKEQSELITKAEEDGKLLAKVTGMTTYSKPALLMREAAALLASNDTPAAIEKMILARTALKENSESLFAVISMLHGLPNMDITLKLITDPGIQRLVDVLAVASAHKVLYRDTNAAKPEDIKTLATQQSKIAKLCQDLSKVDEPHAMLTAAATHLTEAAASMQSQDRAAIKNKQQAAVESLRHFIIEQALVLETLVPPPTPQPGAPDASGPGSDDESEFSAGFIADFVSGEAPKDQRAGWDVRADRNRAALNQNFARELPLEYRGLLKNYYERIAK